VVPIVAGADKFTNLLADWDKYLSPEVERRLPVDGRTFMKLVGLAEIAVGLMVLRRPRLGGALMSGWLALITGNLISTRKYLDIAARDALLAMGRGGAGDDAGPSEDEGTRTDAGPADADGPDRDDPRSVH